MIKAGIYREYDAPFYLDESRLRKIANIIQLYAGKLRGEEIDVLYYVYRENNSYYETSDIETVLSDENGNGKKIDTLVIHIANKKDNKDFFYIEFRSAKDQIRFNIHFKDRDWCYLFADEMENQINRIVKAKPFFIRIGKSFIKITTGIGLLSIVGLLLYGNEIIVSKYFRKDMFMIVIAFGFILGCFFEPHKHINKLAPSIFYWGDMIEVHDKLLSNYNNIKWGIGVAALVSLVTGLLTKYL